MKTFNEYYVEHIHNCDIFSYPYSESVKPIKDIFTLNTYHDTIRDFYNIILAVIATISKYEVLGYSRTDMFNKFRIERGDRIMLPNCTDRAYKILVEQIFTKILLDKDITIDEILHNSISLYNDIYNDVYGYSNI